MRGLALGAVALTLAACAAGSGERFSEATDRMAASCRDRGGVLVPSGRPATGRPETDNVCQINGGASRIP